MTSKKATKNNAIFTLTEAQVKEVRASAALLVGGLAVDTDPRCFAFATLEAVERLDQAARTLESFHRGEQIPTHDLVREIVNGLRNASSSLLEGERRMRHVLALPNWRKAQELHEKL
jgi:hypothetical protein